MGKNKNKSGGFTNYAARKFADASKVPKLSQHKIREILVSDLPIMMDQVAANRAGVKDAKYPQYITNGFANLATAKLLYDHIKCTVKKNKKTGDIDLEKSGYTFAQIDALRVIVANGLSASLTGQFPNEAPDFAERNEYLMKAFQILDPRRYKMTKKLGLETKAARRKLIVSVFLPPMYEIRRGVANVFDKSNLSNKKKMKLLMKLYKMTDDELAIAEQRDKNRGAMDDPNYIPGKYARFTEAIGYAFTIESANSDFTEMLINYVMKQKKPNRRMFIMAFAEAFKSRKTSNFLLKSGDFYEKNRKIIKKLKKMDCGYKKAFRSLKPTESNRKNGKSTRDFPLIGRKAA